MRSSRTPTRPIACAEATFKRTTKSRRAHPRAHPPAERNSNNGRAIRYPRAMTELHDVIVVGGGIAGLAAAWDLRNRDLVVLEAGDRIGGRIRSETRGEHWINLGAHVFAGAGSASDRLIADTGVRAVPVP